MSTATDKAEKGLDAAAENLERARRRSWFAALIVATAVVVAGAAIWLVIAQVKQNSKDTRQDAAITRVIDADPCTKHPPDVQACQNFLRGLAQDGVFPHSLACFIAAEAGVRATNCGSGTRNPSGPAAESEQPRGSASRSSLPGPAQPAVPSTTPPVAQADGTPPVDQGPAGPPGAPGPPGTPGQDGGLPPGSGGGGQGQPQPPAQVCVPAVLCVAVPELPDVGLP